MVLTATVVVIGPSALAWSRGFMAWPAPYTSTIPVGDHLQTAYYLWLWHHALTSRAHLPWLDPFQFAATGHLTYQPFGWPLVLFSLPIDLLSGPVAAYNGLVLAAFVGSAGATYALVRALGGSRAAAAVSGIAFAFAPFRLVQAATHINALLAPLLPFSLLLVERALKRESRDARRAAWATAVVHVSLVASGELHLAVYATILLAGYLALRLPGVPRIRLRLLLPPTGALVIGTVLVAWLEYTYVLRPSIAAGGRTLEEALFFAPRVADLFIRQVAWPTFEHYAYPGAVISHWL
jgi:hypothetical protein